MRLFHEVLLKKMDLLQNEIAYLKERKPQEATVSKQIVSEPSTSQESPLKRAQSVLLNTEQSGNTFVYWDITWSGFQR